MWEIIENNSGARTYSDRLKVMDGWIVRTRIISIDGMGVHQVFVKDINHEWELPERNRE